jgi:peptidoglycan hydrolase-like protein with peptidoglycan-binding domain
MERNLKLINKPYMRGEDVRELQTLLKAAGFDPKGIDGIFGPNTDKAVRAYQKSKGLKVDGIVGPMTWGALHPKAPDVSTEPGGFVSYAASQVGALYVWGGQGQAMTPALIRKMEQNDTDYKRALAI